MQINNKCNNSKSRNIMHEILKSSPIWVLPPAFFEWYRVGIFLWNALACVGPQSNIDQQTSGPQATRCPPRKHPTLYPRPTLGPRPRALHQNDGNPILPETRTEVQFYKLRDLCQYFTRIAETFQGCPYHYMDKIILFKRPAKLYQFILPRNVNTHLLIVLEFPDKLLSKYFC